MRNLLLVLFLFGIKPLFSQTVKPKCLEGNCKNKIGTYLYSDSSIYIGSFSDKLRNGQGKITYKSGATYEGEWVNDKRQGQGVFIDSLKNQTYKNFDIIVVNDNYKNFETIKTYYQNNLKEKEF